MNNIKTLKASVEKAVEDINVAMAENKFTEIMNAKIFANNAIKKLNEAIVSEMFERFLASENPMLEAIKQCYYKSYILKTETDNDTKEQTFSLDVKLEVIDIKALEDTAKTEISVNGQWRYAVEKLAFLLACRVEKDLNLDSDLNSNYKMTKIAKDFDLKGTFTSNTQMLAVLNSILAMIIPECKGLTCDVKYMTYIMVKRGKGQLSVRLPQMKTIQKLITEIAHRIVTNGTYNSEFETVKKA